MTSGPVDGGAVDGGAASARSVGAAPIADTVVPSPATAVRRGLVIGAWTVLAVLLALFPVVFANPTVTTIGIFTLIYMTSAVAWNSFAGYSGYIPLGHAVFFGTGAYTMALVSTHWTMAAGYTMFALVPAAGVTAAIIAVPFGLISLRTRRHTFVVITIAVFFIVQLLAFNLGFTQGSSGVQVPTPLWGAVQYNNSFYYVTLGVLAFAVVFSAAVRRSRFGLQLLAIRDDEDRARGLGVKVQRVKLASFVASAVPVGMVGALYAFFIGQIFPQFAFDPLFDVTVALMAFFGGLGTLSGPLLGALILEPIQQYLTLEYSIGSVYLVIYGGLFLLVILFMPRGIVPTIGERFTARRERQLAARNAAAQSQPVVEVGSLSGIPQ